MARWDVDCGDKFWCVLGLWFVLWIGEGGFSYVNMDFGLKWMDI